MKDVLALFRSLASSPIRLSALGVAAAAVFLLGSSSRIQHPYASLTGFTSFDAPGAGTTANALQGTAAFGINASGEVVGIQTDSGGVHHGIVRAADGTITQFDAADAGTNGNQGTLATSINTNGDVTGYYTDAQQAQHGYIRTAASGTVAEFDVPVAALNAYNKGTNAFAINDGGDVTGQYYQILSTPSLGTPVEHGFIRTANGDFTLFDAANAGSNPTTGTTPIAINAAGVVAGYSGDANRVFHGFVRAADGTMTAFDAPGAGTGGYQGTIAIAIDAGGDVAGLYLDSSSAAHGYIRSSSGTITTFNALGAGTGMLQGTFPVGINSGGSIVGVELDTNYALHAFTRAADGTLASIDAPGAGTGVGTGNLQTLQGSGAFGINDSGAIAGSYLDSNSVSHGFVLAAPAPTPSFAITGTAASVSRGATSGNTSTITVTPSNSFTGAVALTAAVTTSPAGAVDPPTLSFGATSPVSITATTAGTATLTIATTAASTARLAHPFHRDLRWYGAGSGILACVLFFAVPARRGSRTRLIGLLFSLACIGGAIVGCGGSSGTTTGPTNPGTTAGNYTITVTGTSGSTTSTGTVALTVQ